MAQTQDTRERFATARLARLTLFRVLPTLGAGNLALLLGMLIIGGLLPIGVAMFTGVLVGSVPTAVVEGLDSPTGRALLGALGAVAAAYVLQQVIGPFQGAVSETMGRRLDGKLRGRVMRAVLRPAGIAHLEDPDLLDQISIARGVGSSGGFSGFTPGAAVAGMAGVASRYLQTLLFALILFGFRWWIPLVLLPVQVATRLRARKEYLNMVSIYTGQTREMRRSQYYVGLGLAPEGSKEVRSFGLRDWVRERYSTAWLPVVEKVWAHRRASVWSFFPIGIIYWAVQLIVYGLIVRAALAGSIGLGALTVYLIAVGGIAAINQLSYGDLAVEFGMASIPAVLGLEEVTAPAALHHEGKDPSGLPRQGIGFESVSFRYPGSDTEVFSGLDLFIPVGRSLAIVGPNGAGKTTLVKLLSRFYDPTEGRITVDGTDLKAFDPKLWQERVAAIFQDFVRYELTLRENVGFEASEYDEARLSEAAHRAGLEGVLSKLPNGWDTILSRKYTEGTDLSGGEWQRVALARALYAASARPGILVLDEPTANLDVRAEAEIYDRFLELTSGLTTILISHRFSTVRGADLIVVLDEGRVVEQGTHDELMALSGRYAEMFTLQASRFVSTVEQETSGAESTAGESNG